jgi:hypothetical protein
MVGSEKLLLVGYQWIVDDVDVTGVSGLSTRLHKDQSGKKAYWEGVHARVLQTDGDGGDYSGYIFDVDFTGTAGDVIDNVYGYRSRISDVGTDVVVTTRKSVWLESPLGAGAIVTSHGLSIDDQGLASTETKAIYIAAQSQASGTPFAIHQAGNSDLNAFEGDVVVGNTTMAGDEKFRVYDDDDTTGQTNIRSELAKGAAGTKGWWEGVKAQVSHTDGEGGDYTCFIADTNAVGSGDGISNLFGFRERISDIGSGFTVTTHKGIWLEDPLGSGTITTSYGIHIEDQNLSSTTTYGLYIDAQTQDSGQVAAIYQAGSANISIFQGDVVIGAAAMSGAEKLRVVGDQIVEGYVAVNDGAEGTPSVRSRNDPDTGLYWTTSPDTLNFTIGGDQKAYVGGVANLGGVSDTAAVGFYNYRNEVHGVDSVFILRGYGFDDLGAEQQYGQLVIDCTDDDNTTPTGRITLSAEGGGGSLCVHSGVTIGAAPTNEPGAGSLALDTDLYFGDPATDGSWRITISGDDMLIQQRESGSWNTKDTISGA